MKTVQLFAFLLLASVSLAAVSVDDAVRIASGYKDSSESVDIKPQSQVTAAGASYWVAEIYYLGDVFTMVTINSDDGSVVSGDGAAAPVKTHYLANFFASKKDVSDFLTNTLSLTQRIQGDFDTKRDQFTSIWEPQVPQNVTLTKKQAYKDALSSVIAKATALRAQITSLKDVISRVSDEADVDVTHAAFISFFNQEDSFISSLRAAATASTNLVTEVNQKLQEREIDSSLGSGIINSVTMSGLKADADKLEDDVRQSRSVVNTFFDSLDDNTQQFLIRFDQRLQNAADEVVRKRVAERLLNLTDNYTELGSKRDSIDPAFDGAFTEAETLLGQAREFYDNANYTRASSLLNEVQDKLDFLAGKVGSWPPSCGENEYWTGAGCACVSGYVKSGGECVRPSSGGINWVLVGGLVAVLAVVIVLYSKKKSSGGDGAEQLSYAYLGNPPK